MNKLFTKIAMAFIGASMAIGVGVAIGTNKEATRAEAATSLGSTTITFGSASGQWNGINTSTKTDSLGQTWTIAFTQTPKTGKSAYTNASDGYIQIGSNNSDLTTLSLTASTFSQNVKLTAFSFSGTGASNNTKITIQCQMDGSTNLGSSASLNKSNASVTASFSGNQLISSGHYINVKFSGFAAGFKLNSISYTLAAATTQYTVGGTISNGALSSTASVDSGSALNVTLNPSEHYHLPTSLTSVTMGGNALVAGTGYTYNNSTGAIYIASVTGNVLINASCVMDSKYTVTYSAGTNGTGTYAVANQWSGSYTLLAYADISGDGKVNADTGYRFKDYTVGGVTKAPGDTITLSANTTVTVNFEEKPNQAKYLITAVNTAGLDSNFDNTVPTGAGFSFAATYTTNAYQMTADNTQTWTFTGYTNKIITSMKAYVRNNASSGVGAAALTNNSSSVTLGKSSFTGLGGTYAEYELLKEDLEVAGSVVLTLSCSTNSFFCQYVLLEWEDADTLDEDLTIDDSSATTEFTVGDEFEFGGTATATYSVSGDVDVTDDVTFTLGSTDIAEGETITSSMLDSATTTSEVIEVAVWFKDAKGNAAAGAYDVTVSYAPVESVEIDDAPASLGKLSSYTLGAAVSPENAHQGVTWSATSSDLTDGEDFEIDEDTGELTVTASSGGTITVIATSIGEDGNGDNVESESVNITITGDPVVTLSNSSLSGFSGKTGTLSATPANFSGTPTYTWTSSDSTKVSITGSGSSVTINYVAATASAVTITCTATYSTEEASATCSVSVTASAVSSVTWSNSSNMTVYSGSTALNAAKITAWAPKYEKNNGDTGDVTSDYTVQLNGSAYTLGTALTAGTYTVTLTYGGVTTAASNPVVTVIQSLNTINASRTYTWEANGTTDDFTTTSTTLNGVSWTNTVPSYTNKAAGTVSKRYIQIGKGDAPESFSISTTGISGTITKVTVDCASGSAGHTIAISVGGTSYLAATATPTWSSNNGGTKSGTGNKSGQIAITFNKASNTKAMYIHSIEVEYTVDIVNSNDHMAAQAKVVEFAQYMNTQMNGTKVCTGDMSNLGTAWGNVSSKYTALFGAGSSLSSTELAYAKDMLANATASWNEEHDSDEKYCLERAMATYEWCVSHYSSTCTAFMSAVRPIEANHTNPILSVFKADSANLATVMIVISMITATAIGGYFFLKKRKEER